jgi:hypothetical protein
MTRTTKNSQNNPRGKRAAAAAAAPAAAADAPAAATKKLVAEVPMKQEAAAVGGEEKKGETKYHGCSREELLDKILEIRTKGKKVMKKGNMVKFCKIPKDDQLKIRSYRRELAELYLELRKRGMRFVKEGFGKNTIGLNLDSTTSIHASVAADGVGDDGSAAEQDVVFSSTDDEVGGALAPPGPLPPCHPWAYSSMCRFRSCCRLPHQTPSPHTHASPAHSATPASNVANAIQLSPPVRGHTAFLFVFSLTIPPAPPHRLPSCSAAFQKAPDE